MNKTVTGLAVLAAWLRKAVDWLTAPSARITDPELRSQARLLAAILLALIPLGFLVVILPPLFKDGVTFWNDNDAVLMSASMVFWLPAYILCRRGSIRLATLLVMFAGSLLIISEAVLDNDLYDLNYLLLVLLFGTAVLPVFWLSLLAGLYIVIILALPFFFASFSWLQVVVIPLSYLVIGSVLILLVSRYREKLLLQRQQSLEAGEERLKELARLAQVGIYEMDLQSWRFTVVNDYMCARTGYTRAEFLSMDPLDLLAPESRDAFRLAQQMLPSVTELPDQLEYAICTKGGRRLTVHLRLRPVYQAGKPVKVIVAAHDITPIKVAQQSLQKTTARLQTFVEIDQAILTSPDIQKSVDRVLHLIAELMPGVRPALVALDDTAQVGVTWAVYRRGESDFQRGVRIPFSQMPYLQRCRREETVLVDDLEALSSPSQAEKKMLAQGIRSYYMVPLRVRERLVGVLVFMSQRAFNFTPESCRLAEHFASSLALAFYQARLQQDLRAHTARLESSLKEKEVLLKEVHHRVKNNLQIISSLLNLQAGRLQNAEAIDALQDSRHRVRTMAMIHEALYHSGNFGEVDFAAYLERLTGYLLRANAMDGSLVHLDVQAEPLSLPLDRAIPGGLIASELITNALKHAYPLGSSGVIRVTLQSAGEGAAVLEVSDDGVGLPEDFDPQREDTLGWKLVESLTSQLEGSLSVENQNTCAGQPGTRVQLRFKRAA